MCPPTGVAESGRAAFHMRLSPAPSMQFSWVTSSVKTDIYMRKPRRARLSKAIQDMSMSVKRAGPGTCSQRLPRKHNFLRVGGCGNSFFNNDGSLNDFMVKAGCQHLPPKLDLGKGNPLLPGGPNPGPGGPGPGPRGLGTLVPGTSKILASLRTQLLKGPISEFRGSFKALEKVCWAEGRTQFVFWGFSPVNRDL